MMTVVLLTQHQTQRNVNILVSVIKHVLIIHQLVNIIDGVVLRIINIAGVYVLEKNMNQILVLDVLLKVQKYLQVQVIKI